MANYNGVYVYFTKSEALKVYELLMQSELKKRLPTELKHKFESMYDCVCFKNKIVREPENGGGA